MRAPALALVALSVAVVIGAVMTIGGPEQARAERRDAQRMSDLNALGRHLTCLLDRGLALDDTSDACTPPPPLTDPKTGAPYQVTRTAPDIVRACAEFERPARSDALAYRADFDRDAGCLILRRTPTAPAPRD